MSQTELMWHAYSQFLGIVIDVTGLDWVEDMGLVTIDLDHGELWHFLYFDADGILIHKDTIAAGGASYDGEAFPISWTDDEYSIAKVVVFGEMNTNIEGMVGYAIDNICITSVVQEETAWGDGLDFPGKNWATYFTYHVQLLAVLGGIAEWSTTQSNSPSYSVHIGPIPNTTSGGKVTVYPTVTIMLKDITTLRFYEYVDALDTGNYRAFCKLYLDADSNGTADAKLTFEAAGPAVTGTESWYDSWVLRDVTDTAQFAGWDQTGNFSGYQSLAAWQATATIQDYTLIKVMVGASAGLYVGYDGYIDDITINSLVFDFD
ncbi:hypothetical protein ES702_06144 [subsurface metagenome]